MLKDKNDFPGSDSINMIDMERSNRSTSRKRRYNDHVRRGERTHRGGCESRSKKRKYGNEKSDSIRRC